MKIKIEYKLYELRRKKKMTIRELAKLSGVSKSAINKIENNIGNPTVFIVCQLAVALDVEPSDLFEYIID